MSSPFVVDDSRAPVPRDFAEQVSRLVASGQRGAAVKLFMADGVLVPKVFVALMTLMPAWRRLKAVAHTLAYDLAFMVGTQQGQPLPAGRWNKVTQPALVLNGGNSPTWMKHATRALADKLANARHQILDGQTHLVKPKALAPVLAEFFNSERGAADTSASRRSSHEECRS